MQGKKPICILFAGPVGTSKTPIAIYLSWNLGLPVFNNDVIRTEVHEDALSESLDNDLYLKKRDERLERVISYKKSFILDASIDRQWEELKKKLEKVGFQWLIISIDLDRDYIMKLYKSKNYSETIEQLDRLITEHNAFLDNFRNDITLTIDNQNFQKRLDLSLETVKSFLQ